MKEQLNKLPRKKAMNQLFIHKVNMKWDSYLSPYKSLILNRLKTSGVQDGEHMFTHGWFMSMYGKNHYNILK